MAPAVAVLDGTATSIVVGGAGMENRSGDSLGEHQWLADDIMNAFTASQECLRLRWHATGQPQEDQGRAARWINTLVYPRVALRMQKVPLFTDIEAVTRSASAHVDPRH